MNQIEITLPKFLYRYFPKDNYTKSIFNRNELFFRNPNEFNDPFDCKPLLTSERDWNQEEYIRFVINLANDSLGRYLNNGEKQSYENGARDKFINSDRNQLCREFNKIIKEHLAKSINEFRILCLSEKYNDILMWSHYADKHRGFVLQFDTEVLLQSFSPRPQEIFYPPEESYPSIKDFNEKGCMNMFLITKSSHWAYEKEWRILMHIEDEDNPEEEGKVYRFEKGLITGIIFGCEMKSPEKTEISEWVREYQPQIIPYDAIKDDNFYHINAMPQLNECGYSPSKIS